MRDEHTLPLQEFDVGVTLQDGRVFDGWTVRYEYGVQCERVRFAG